MRERRGGAGGRGGKEGGTSAPAYMVPHAQPQCGSSDLMQGIVTPCTMRSPGGLPISRIRTPGSCRRTSYPVEAAIEGRTCDGRGVGAGKTMGVMVRAGEAMGVGGRNEKWEEQVKLGQIIGVMGTAHLPAVLEVPLYAQVVGGG